MLRWLVWRGSFETLRGARLLPSSMGAGYSLFYACAQTSAGGTSVPSATAEIITTIRFRAVQSTCAPIGVWARIATIPGTEIAIPIVAVSQCRTASRKIARYGPTVV